MSTISRNFSIVVFLLIAIFFPLGAYASEDQDVAIYCNYLESRIKKKWKSIDGLDDSAKYSIVLDKLGKVKSMRVVSSCKSMKSSEKAMSWLQSFKVSVEPPVVPFNALVTVSNKLKLIKVESDTKKKLAVAPSVPVAVRGKSSLRPEKGAVRRPTVVADPDFAPFMIKLQRKLAKTWYPPRGTEHLTPTVTFKIKKDGTVSHIQIKKSAGNPAADKAACQAVKNAAPFSGLPSGSPASVDMVFSFNYKALKHLSGR